MDVTPTSCEHQECTANRSASYLLRVFVVSAGFTPFLFLLVSCPCRFRWQPIGWTFWTASTACYLLYTLFVFAGAEVGGNQYERHSRRNSKNHRDYTATRIAYCLLHALLGSAGVMPFLFLPGADGHQQDRHSGRSAVATGQD